MPGSIPSTGQCNPAQALDNASLAAPAGAGRLTGVQQPRLNGAPKDLGELVVQVSLAEALADVLQGWLAAARAAEGKAGSERAPHPLLPCTAALAAQRRLCFCRHMATPAPLPVGVVNNDVKHVSDAQPAHRLVHVVAQPRLPLARSGRARLLHSA